MIPMNKLRDLLIDGVLMTLPLAAVAYLVHKVVLLLVTLLKPPATITLSGLSHTYDGTAKSATANCSYR